MHTLYICTQYIELEGLSISTLIVPFIVPRPDRASMQIVLLDIIIFYVAKVFTLI